ncbi:MAG: peptidoglycan DD-metalloendopeptidase family protein [Lysobacterales bacterium]
MSDTRHKKICCIAIALTVTAGLIGAAAHAKRIYTYQDENGITHFTDRPPDTDQPVEERVVRVDNTQMVTVRQGGKPEAREYYFTSRWEGPSSVSISYTKSSNVRAEPRLPATFMLPGTEESHLITIYQDNPRLASEYGLEFRNAPGDPQARPDTRQRYQLPFRRGEKFYIGQGFGGQATHNDTQSFHALDIGMPEGTPVLAARDGIVMHVDEDFYGAGTNIEKFAHRANHVRVLHEDGSMAVYAHLALESVAVRSGRVVTAGELLGLSGNTGYSTGPHLHFVIQKNDNGELKSLPFRFQDGSEDGLIPKAGEWLEH